MRPISFHSFLGGLFRGGQAVILLIFGAGALLFCSPYIVVGWIQDRLQKPGPGRRGS